ncbi:G-protein coupled receptor moody [Helicoverpa armigera]|uniref:G-protein coupled receptor moody n=1 Tax=Helicoverpa armigera TaxID=29058 RepID=UPI003082D4C6
MMAYEDKLSALSENRFTFEFNSSAELVMVPLFQNYSDTLLNVATACCAIFVVIGIPGNLITIVALARFKKIRNATAIFIINLHISDLLFCSIILPMTAMTFAQKKWTHGWIMCQLYPYLKFSLNATSIFTILAISINRYIMVCHPMWYPRFYKRRNISIMILLMWASALAIFLPSILGKWGRYELEPSEGFCTMLEDRKGNSPKTFFLCVSFVGPYLVIALCYARIWWLARKTGKKPGSHNPRLTETRIRPTHLPLSHTTSDTSMEGRTLISFDPSSPGSSSPDDVPTPREEQRFNYFKAPFRLTRREVRPKAPTRKDKKLCAMIAAIMLSFCVSHLPLMIARLAYKEYKYEPVANVAAHLLGYFGTCSNPIIYVIMSSEYRQAYRSLFDAIKHVSVSSKMSSSQ